MLENNLEKVRNNFVVDTADIEHGRVKVTVAPSAIPEGTPEGDVIQFKQGMLTTNDALQLALVAARKAGLNDPAVKQHSVVYINAKTGQPCRSLHEMQQANVDLLLDVRIHSDTLTTATIVGDSLVW